MFYLSLLLLHDLVSVSNHRSVRQMCVLVCGCMWVHVRECVCVYTRVCMHGCLVWSSPACHCLGLLAVSAYASTPLSSLCFWDIRTSVWVSDRWHWCPAPLHLKPEGGNRDEGSGGEGTWKNAGRAVEEVLTSFTCVEVPMKWCEVLQKSIPVIDVLLSMQQLNSSDWCTSYMQYFTAVWNWFYCTYFIHSSVVCSLNKGHKINLKGCEMINGTEK